MSTKSHRLDWAFKEWRLQSWSIDSDNASTIQRGIDDQTMPVWLQEIVSVAKVGGHIIDFDHPPPSALVWFSTDEAGNLITFDNPPGVRRQP